jgi:molecular chaperone Hsp33
MDSLQNFIFEHANIRGEIAHLDLTYSTILQQRNYPPIIRNWLGEALVSCLLLTGTIKFEGQLSVQFQGDSRLPLLLAQCDHQGNLRAYAKFEENLSDKDYASAFLEGKMAITINQYTNTESYQSLVPIKSTSLAEILMHYFIHSEQITTGIWLAVKDNKAAGMLIQLLPGQNSEQREEFWEYAMQIGKTITEDELLNLDNETLLHRLYHETELRIFEPTFARFHCSCTVEKMQQAIKILGQKEANKILQDQEKIEIHCEFCNHHYSFDAIDVTMLFSTT